MDSITEKNREWEGLHVDLLSVIVRKLSYSDAVRFSAACTSWLGAAKTCWIFSQPLLLTVAEPNEQPSLQIQLRRLSEGKLSPDVSKAVIPHRGVNNCICSKGRIVLMSFIIEAKVDIINLFSGEKFHIPPVPALLFGIDNSLGCLVLKAAIFAPSDQKRSDEENLILVIGCRFPKPCIVYYKDGSWAMLQMGYQCEDIIAHESRLFVLSRSGSVNVWEFDQIGSDHPPTKVISYVPSEMFTSITASPGSKVHELVYLIRSIGEFLLVRMLRFKPNSVGSFYNSWQYDSTLTFEVYKSCLGSEEKWEKVDSLGDDRALFLGNNESVSVSGLNLQKSCKANSIYYTRDDRAPYTCHDMEVYSMEHKKVNFFQAGFNENKGELEYSFWLVKENLDA